MREIQEFLLGWGVQAGLPENSSDNVFLFLFQFSSYFTVLQRVSNGYFKRNFPRFQREFNIFQGRGGVQLFPGKGGGMGSNMLNSIRAGPRGAGGQFKT